MRRAIAISADRVRRLLGHRFPPLGGMAFRTFSALLPNQIDSELFPGIRIELDLTDHTQLATYWQGSRYEAPTSDVLINWTAPSCTHFFDIGANYGFFSLLLRSCHDHLKIHSFEPNPSPYRHLSQTVDRNQLSDLTTWNLGLGDRRECLHLQTGFADAGHATFTNHPGATTAAEHLVEVVAFDDWVRDQSLPLPSSPSWVAKIDVEGFELNVLKGMKNSLNAQLFRGICVEINDFTLDLGGTNAAAIRDLMTSHGYIPKRVASGRASAGIGNEFFVPKPLTGPAKV